MPWFDPLELYDPPWPFQLQVFGITKHLRRGSPPSVSCRRGTTGGYHALHTTPAFIGLSASEQVSNAIKPYRAVIDRSPPMRRTAMVALESHWALDTRYSFANFCSRTSLLFHASASASQAVITKVPVHKHGTEVREGWRYCAKKWLGKESLSQKV